MLASSLADKNNLVRIIVLKSLFNMNYSGLVQKLGGLLNRRIYFFPCNRDKNFEQKDIEMYEKLLKECQNNKGIVITLPEYMLSFKLKGIELSSISKKEKLASKLIGKQIFDCIFNKFNCFD